MVISSKAKASSKTNTRDRIRELEEEVEKTKYNKKTQRHIGLIKAKIAMLKEKQQQRMSSKGKGEGFSVKRSGDGTVIMVGFPSVGKSTLLNALTKAKSQVGSYAFTTLTCIPGLLEYKDAKIQVLDVPGIIRGAAAGTGRGKEVLACAHSADLVLLVIDVFHPEHHPILLKEVYDTHLRLNKVKPVVKITKRDRGGIDFGATVKLTKINRKITEDILKEFKINNASIVIRDNIEVDELIDGIEGNKKYVPAITVLNKIDLATEEQINRAKKMVKPDLLISAETKDGIENLKEVIFKKLGFLRIYCKEQGKKADLDVPLILKEPATLKTMCEKLHREFVEKFTYARIWGAGVKFDGQVIRKLTHPLKDGDVVEIHLR